MSIFFLGAPFSLGIVCAIWCGSAATTLRGIIYVSHDVSQPKVRESGTSARVRAAPNFLRGAVASISDSIGYARRSQPKIHTFFRTPTHRRPTWIWGRGTASYWPAPSTVRRLFVASIKMSVLLCCQMRPKFD